MEDNALMEQLDEIAGHLLQQSRGGLYSQEKTTELIIEAIQNIKERLISLERKTK
jgi:hypothetical protein